MATVDTRLDPSAALPERAIHGLLGRLRFLIRAYVLVEGLAWCIVCAGLVFWASLAIDWLLEPSREVRAALLLLFAGPVGFVFLQRVVGRGMARLSNSNMAVLLERRYDTFNDRLLTAVELEGRHSEQTGYSDEMLSHTRREAAELVRSAGVWNVFDMAPLLRACVLAVLAALSVAMFGSFQQPAFAIWGNRVVLLGDEVWPRESRIVVEGFEEDETGRRVLKVGMGDHVVVNALADTNLSIPELVEVRYTTEAGLRGTQGMVRIGNAIPGRDDWQPFRHRFDNVQSSTEFSVVARQDSVFGKADRVDNLWIEVVPTPGLRDLDLECEYPAYLQRSAGRLRVTGAMALPEGTRIVVEAAATKPLTAAECGIVVAGETVRTVSIVPEAADSSRFRCEVGTLQADTELLFTLVDTDGVSNRQPIRLQINMIPDEAPLVEARFAGIGTAITPRAMLPLAGEITDDYGVARTWFEYRIDQEEPQEREFTLPAGGLLEQDPPIALDVTDLRLEPGQKFLIGVKAADYYDLGDGPNVESSRRVMLDVVTESDLRGLLEARELLLRRRLEEIAGRMSVSQDSLARIDLELIFRPAPESAAEEPNPARSETTRPSGTEDTDASAGEETEVEPREPEAGDGTASPAEADGEEQPEAASRTVAEPEPQQTPTARLRTIAILTADESLQNSERSGHETREIAVSFEDILVELRNNRVSYIDELELRLQNQIANPLHEISDENFPRLDEHLRNLREALEQNDRAAAETALVGAEREIDTILFAMSDVLSRMKELQNFNELLARLREIIATHERISRMTEERRNELRDSLRRGLLDD